MHNNNNHLSDPHYQKNPYNKWQTAPSTSHNETSSGYNKNNIK